MGATNSKKRFAILDPYLDTLGGGERYVLTIAEHYRKKARVDLFWERASIKEAIFKRFNIDIDGVNLLPFEKKMFRNYYKTRQYDIFFYVTDGSLFLSNAKKSILIVQSPVHIPKINSIFDNIKLRTWPIILCYSHFMERIIEDRLKREAQVLYPPVDTKNFKPLQKENIILSTGRFFSHLHSKKQAFLVEVFSELYKSGIINDWKLVFIGSVETSDYPYFKEIKAKTKGLAIEFLANASFDRLKDYCGKAKLFWLATGYGENLEINPDRAEHFGIASIEAMAAGCVPLVFKGGGQTEIVVNNQNGYFFETKQELISRSLEMIKNDRKRIKIAQNARLRSSMFSNANFIARLNEII